MSFSTKLICHKYVGVFFRYRLANYEKKSLDNDGQQFHKYLNKTKNHRPSQHIKYNKYHDI
jgi:hypothetical protein